MCVWLKGHLYASLVFLEWWVLVNELFSLIQTDIKHPLHSSYSFLWHGRNSFLWENIGCPHVFCCAVGRDVTFEEEGVPKARNTIHTQPGSSKENHLLFDQLFRFPSLLEYTLTREN